MLYVFSFYSKFPDEVYELKEQLGDALKKVNEKDSAISALKLENDDIKAAAAILQSSKDDDVNELRRKFQEEAASLHHIMKGTRMIKPCPCT